MPLHHTSREPSVSMHVVRMSREHLAVQGVDPETFDRLVGIGPLEMARVDGWLDARRFRQARKLVEATGRLADLRDRTPLAWTQWTSRHWPELTALWFNCPTLGDAALTYARYRPLVNEADPIDCEVEGDQLVMSCTLEPNAGSGLIAAVSQLTGLQDLVHYYQQRTSWPISAHFEIGELDRPCSKALLGEILQAPVTLNPSARTQRLVLQGRGLWAPVEGHNQFSSTWARQILDARLQALAQRRPIDQFVTRIEDLVQTRWQEVGTEGVEADLNALQRDVACVLGMSRWTLRRNLAAHGVDFSSLVEHLRAQQLPVLMADPTLSLLNIGARLGFASQSAFSRYFRNRYGHPPSRDPTWLHRS
ncbi:AraC family transcriptional regulator [Sphaerotilus hippei]|uniref:AraC family transcriptional regulator n=2 Tax=Sphaerotilus hippei TaxID=744406 RepID=A0A318H6P0_9BURK|nr:AraC family transcriptional regulator [Sphaerotilus hippei]